MSTVTDSAGVTCRMTPMRDIRPGDVVVLGWETTVERVETDVEYGAMRIVWETGHVDQWNSPDDELPVLVGERNPLAHVHTIEPGEINRRGCPAC